MMKLLRVVSLCFTLAYATSSYAVVDSFAPIVERALPAVVNISTTQKVQASPFGLPGMGGLPGLQGERQEELEKFFERFGMPFSMPEGQQRKAEREVNSLGSGFVIDPKGYVVTNNHVIAEASEILVIFSDDTKLEAQVIGRDPKTDLALLKVESDKPLPYVEFGDSDKMRVGDWVIAIGNPFGLGGTVTAGIISARSRNINAGPFDDFLQSDAAINRGNSGGPMFNTDGDVIGVNTAIFSPSGGNVGIGFAIPTAMAKPILDQLREYGKPYRGWLGVKIQHVTEEISESLGLTSESGALVLEVTKGSPAAKANLEPGDVILSFNGKRVKEMRQLPRMVADTPVGKAVTVKVWRQGSEKILQLTLGEFPEEPLQKVTKAVSKEVANADGEKVLGMYLVPLDQASRLGMKLPEDVQGIIVAGIKPKSEALSRGLKAGDVIAGVNQQDVTSVEQFRDSVSQARKAGRGYVLVRIIRGKNSSYITLPITK